MTKTATKTSTKTRKSRSNWSHDQGPFLGAANAASAALAVASVGSLPELEMPWWGPAGVGLLGCAVAFTRAATGQQPWFVRMFRAGRWVALTGWCTYALATGGPWEMATLTTLLMITLAAGILQPASRSYEIAAQERAEAEAELSRRRGHAGEWERRIQRVCQLSVQVTDINEWTAPAPDAPDSTRVTGMSILVTLPEGKSSWRTLHRYAEELAADADLPAACGVEVQPYEGRKRALLLVSTEDVLAEPIPAGDDVSPLSIYDRLPGGMHRDSSQATITLKWESAVLIGATGSGKSAQLTQATCQLLRCVDALVMGIDFNGGKAFKPFLRPWLDGRAAKPAIDWVATDTHEAALMLDFLLDAISTRSSGHADLMAQANDDKIPASPAVPHIGVITDETADLPDSIKRRLVELSNRSRAASIRPLTCALRAVSAGGAQLPKELIAQAQVRTAMRVNEKAELQRLFGFSTGLPAPEEMPEPGYGVIQPDVGQPPRLFRGTLVSPADASKVAEATDDRRPLLDEVTVNTNSEVYLNRWKRAQDKGWLNGQAPPAPSVRDAAPPHPTATTQQRPLTDIDLKGAAEQARQKRREHEERNRTRRSDHSNTTDRFDELIAHAWGDDIEVPPLLTEAIAALDEHGDGSRVHTSVVAERVGLTDAGVRRLLRLIEVEPAPNPFWVAGTKARGYYREALEDAAARIRSGQTPVPDEVSNAL